MIVTSLLVVAGMLSLSLADTTCPAGEYLNSASICVQCSAGYYCPGTTYAATPCPAGTASAAVNTSSETTCTVCECVIECFG